MKRHGQLLARIADPANLRLAFWKAAKGKRAKADCRTFQENLDANLSALRADVLARQARAGDYHYFTVHDPKERFPYRDSDSSPRPSPRTRRRGSGRRRQFPSPRGRGPG